MTIPEWILLIITAPLLAFLCMRWGVSGFYRGKEVSGKQNEFDDEQKNETEN